MHHDPPTSHCRPAAPDVFAIPRPAGIGLRAEAAAARTTVFDLEREYQADQSSLREAFELPASKAYLDRQENLAAEWRARLEKLDFASLDPREKAEYVLLRSEVQGWFEETIREEAAGGDRATAAVLPDHP